MRLMIRCQNLKRIVRAGTFGSSDPPLSHLLTNATADAGIHSSCRREYHSLGIALLPDTRYTHLTDIRKGSPHSATAITMINNR